MLGPFKTTDEMCVAVNNLEYVRRSLAEFGVEIKWVNFNRLCIFILLNWIKQYSQDKNNKFFW